MSPNRKDICDCGVLESISREPGSPVQWDERLNEYHIVDARGRRLMVYFCPICGGSTPESRRSSLFAHITEPEEARIFELFRGIRTVSDVIARFGQPDEDQEFASFVRSKSSAGKPEHGEAFRGLVYKRLSPVAEIVFEVGANDSVRGRWSQKYVGDEQAASR